ncbi:unnamed protein product [Fusarium graminearum]|uniref:Chromosome 1, complete genome n=1 Tax=Gibberella zeae (strain ATCC MYA-4620 / CBS 123657 / FGSC 9075 / NRRL 31084 / PH-1) TaxID=229533 RepID=I1SA38_GIBZE|nr:hypothetical protein FGSG_13719 [Fusarium graminearum PH-1]ESU16875.1 hypothetical protein FGSG_13719 [Fusarium graminearum PH-1]CEF75556.1 unnamed protein product [Fusarium graminearum]CZS78835.1 unnamed protein product [Fusarium graminearum]|eukprot:XP_011319137.1 hypothetical protein FGSG_13719 [Fusarium graminearum PH-1]
MQCAAKQSIERQKQRLVLPLYQIMQGPGMIRQRVDGGEGVREIERRVGGDYLSHGDASLRPSRKERHYTVNPPTEASRQAGHQAGIDLDIVCLQYPIYGKLPTNQFLKITECSSHDDDSLQSANRLDKLSCSETRLVQATFYDYIP